MRTFYDHLWHGQPDVVAAAVLEIPNVIGPRVLDGVAYVNVRTDEPLPLPEGLSVTGPQLSIAILGVWASEVQPTAPVEE